MPCFVRVAPLVDAGSGDQEKPVVVCMYFIANLYDFLFVEHPVMQAWRDSLLN